MVVLNRIYTRTGDTGTTRLATGEPVSKASARIAANGEVDELNACLGLVRQHTADTAFDPIVGRVQNELFDLGADLSTPDRQSALRVTEHQVAALEADIDALNATLSPLTSFVLPGGGAASAYLHLARTVCRRAERACVALASEAEVSPEALKYLNRLSDLLFVAARAANDGGAGDVLWVPGATR
jgi:cob(I)alamin adenosyltransferase